jgi:hypothetical protein
MVKLIGVVGKDVASKRSVLGVEEFIVIIRIVVVLVIMVVLLITGLVRGASGTLGLDGHSCEASSR